MFVSALSLNLTHRSVSITRHETSCQRRTTPCRRPHQDFLGSSLKHGLTSIRMTADIFLQSAPDINVPRYEYGSRKRSVWIQPITKQVFTTSIEQGFTIVVHDNLNQLQDWSRLAKHTGLLLDSSKNQLALVNNSEAVSCTTELAPVFRIDDADDQQRVLSAIRQLSGSSMCVVDINRDSAWAQIACENLIAACNECNIKLVAIADSCQTTLTMFDSLQRGVDGVVLKTGSVEEIIKLSQALKSSSSECLSNPEQNLTFATVARIKPAGLGDRVCVDTCSILSPNEGMFVGSSAQGMFLVASEAMENDYVASRPFRVNASAVCAYCMLPNNKTKYLVELEAGDCVLIYDFENHSQRTVTVGRVKIERRPFLLLQAYVALENGPRTSFSILVQNAETVRLATGQGKTQSVTQIQVGDQVLIKTSGAGRHTGIAVDEVMIEK